MKTAEGKYNESKIEKVYELCKSKLNKAELAFLTDKLVIDKYVMIKTAELVMLDFTQSTI